MTDHPHEGGSYTRDKDGGALKRVAFTAATPAPAAKTAAQAAPPAKPDTKPTKSKE